MLPQAPPFRPGRGKLSIRHCQTNWPGAEEAVIRVISGSKLLPLDEGSGSSLFENVSSVEMALVVEVVVD